MLRLRFFSNLAIFEIISIFLKFALNKIKKNRSFRCWFYCKSKSEFESMKIRSHLTWSNRLLDILHCNMANVHVLDQLDWVWLLSSNCPSFIVDIFMIMMFIIIIIISQSSLLSFACFSYSKHGDCLLVWPKSMPNGHIILANHNILQLASKKQRQFYHLME